ncbi:glycosyltransferase family 2 protein [Desulforhopalus sp. 52FAK]
MPFCPVSVVIPTYNREQFLKRAIDSVCKQVLSCKEIIIVNDGSTDNSLELLRKIKSESVIPIVIINTDNQGVAAARNIGIHNATCDFIAFLDSDDHWHKRKLERQFNALFYDHSHYISHTKEKWLRRGQHLNQKKKHIPRHGDIFSHCLQLCAVGMSTVMVHKELFEKVGCFDEKLRCCEDYDLWLRVSSKYPFLLVDSPLTIKEGGREDQLSYIHRLGMDEKRIYSIRKLLDSGELDSQNLQLAHSEFERKVRIFADGCIKHGKTEIGTQYLRMLEDYT